MKKWSNALLLTLVLALLTGCSLAQPERRRQEEDEFIGFQVVFGPRESNHDSEGWTSYGSETLDISGLGSFQTDRRVLFARYDAQDGIHHFQGMEGINAFLTTQKEPDGIERSFSGYTHLSNAQITVGDATKLKGTIYFLGGDEDQFVTLYRVYQTPDGRIYLDGSGNSYGGAGGFGVTEKVEYQSTSTGLDWLDEEVDATSTSFEIALQLEALSPLVQLELIQYDAQNALIQVQPIPLAPETQTVPILPETAWVLVVEQRADGTVTRTVQQRPADPQQSWGHTAWTIGEDRLGQSLVVEFTSP